MHTRATRKVTALDVVALLATVLDAARDSEIGIQDANRTLAEMLRELNKPITLTDSLIESALWCGNMLNEKGKYKHPGNQTFEQFARKLAGPNQTFDKNYNYFKDRE